MPSPLYPFSCLTVVISSKDSEQSYLEQLPHIPDASYDKSLGCTGSAGSALIAEVVNCWSQSNVADKRIFVLSGPDGTDMTPIAHSVAFVCDRKHQSLGKSFFHTKSNISRHKPDQLIGNIVQELSEKNSTFASQRKLVKRVQREKPRIAGASVRHIPQGTLAKLLQCRTEDLDREANSKAERHYVLP